MKNAESKNGQKMRKKQASTESEEGRRAERLIKMDGGRKKEINQETEWKNKWKKANEKMNQNKDG